MSGLFDETYENGKILYIGDSGHGKTGSKAALIATGMKFRGIDTDKGAKLLRALLTDEDHYPYAKWMKKNNIDPRETVSIKAIDVPVGVESTLIKGVNYDLIAPKSSAAWATVVKALKEWKDGDHNFGSISDWDNDTVLDFDTLSTLGECAKFWIQGMNGRLGSLVDEHGRDTGDAQELIRRLMMQLTNSSVVCNVILSSHITWVDQSNHAAESPEARLRAQKSVDARGFPSAIGRALSPTLPKRWNDSFVVRRTGSGDNVKRKIYTRPIDNTDAKNSVWLKPEYDIETGLAEIFAALRYRPQPEEFVNFCQKFKTEGTKTQEQVRLPTGTGVSASGGFGIKR